MIPRHCRTAKTIATAVATATAPRFPLSAGKSAPANSPIKRDTPAVEPQVEIQSLQPTRKPAYSPNAWRAKTYCPPFFGIMRAELSQGDRAQQCVEPTKHPHSQEQRRMRELQCNRSGTRKDSPADGVADNYSNAKADPQHAQEAVAFWRVRFSHS